MGTLSRLCLSLGLAGASLNALAATLYVSPKGNDAWSGRLPAPNVKHTDGPFATPVKAQMAARNKPGTSILFRGGMYRLPQPLVLIPADSGVTWAAYRRETPVISGGIQPTDRRLLPNGRWELRFAAGTPAFEQLFVNGHRRYRPRLPKNGYYRIAGYLAPSKGDKPDRFRFQPGEFRPDWANLSDVQALCFHQWTMQRLRVAAVDDAANTVTFTGATWHPTMAALGAGDRFLIENVKEALSEPGEWYREPSTGVVTYIPMPGEKIETADIVAPVLSQLMEIKGAHDVTFRGITFAHTGYITPPAGRSFPQAEIDLGAAITASNARNCALDSCTITHTGEYAVEWKGGSTDCAMRRCHLTDLGAGGIKVGDTSPDRTERITVQDCRIAHGGRIHPAAIGVWIGQSANNLISHNSIEDFYYTGVSVGWVWGYAASGSHHNRIEDNVIANIGQAVLSDLGGIYTLGLSPGSVLRGNIIHDCDSDTYGGWGIYFDEGTTGMLAENNLVYHTKTGGFHQHYGENNILRNNIFALSRESQIQRTRMEPHLSFTFERNVVYYRQGVLLGSNWGDANFTMDYNLYWNPKDSVRFLSHPLNEWQKDKGKELHSVVADPGFVDPEHGDFHLKPGSPALKIGFKPWDYTKAGPRMKFPKDDVPPAFPVILPKYE
ncbi:MAG TPA: right-handed parallel beta-helix repeat-containing protein [Armatimonadota bacterium]|jgi:hypothetical protein